MSTFEYPITFRKVLHTSADVPPVEELFTGAAFTVSAPFTCPITGTVLALGEFIFWDESSGRGVWRSFCGLGH